MLPAKAKGAQLLGATAVTMRDTSIYSIRHLHGWRPSACRRPAMGDGRSIDAKPDSFRHEAEDAVLLIESSREDTYRFAMGAFEH